MNMVSDRSRVLVTVTGKDTPGITAALTSIIATNDAELLDIEQVVVQGRLTLCLLLSLDKQRHRGDPVLKDLLFTAKDMGLELDFQVLPDEDTSVFPRRHQFAVTIFGDRVGAEDLGRVAEVLARHQANIDRILRLAGDPLSSVEFVVSLAGGQRKDRELRGDLLVATSGRPVDIAVQRENLSRRSKRLVVMDMDSTLIQMEIIDEMARLHGVATEVSSITHRAMNGELNFEESLQARVGLLAGLAYSDCQKLALDLPLSEGAERLLRVLKTLGYRTGVISGGFTFAADALKRRLGLDYAYANQLEIENGKLTGKVRGPIVGPQRKSDLLDVIAQLVGFSLEQTIAIGDGANDLAMLERAGLGIAFHAKPKLREAADTSVSAGGLDRILYLLGLSQQEVSELLGETAEAA
ncbi:MAG: phosphoserine phosphatase SerB [Myxococcota bacterium]